MNEDILYTFDSRIMERALANLARNEERIKESIAMKFIEGLTSEELRSLADKKDNEYDNYFRLVDALEEWTEDQLIPSMKLNDISAFTFKVKNGKVKIKTGE